ncbi:PREDICTED: putative odorant-binding protein A10 [Nicrophorus vespilloides]|uniref:Odorant-binding protein A10 n=1 Tax=Nicrophorus vespilloides TaxID=110193 RepID=A0ABM1MVN3_NICVS|nr:PREDICTED: putative odorant-binding protein A10 [Nicrophorus vespilloides]
MHLVQICFVVALMMGISGVFCAPQATKRPEISEDALEMALSDKRYLMRQLKCALGEAPCDPVGRRLKSLAPLVLRGSCPQCTPMEMRQIQKVLAHVQRNFPNEWSKVINQYAG